MLSVKRISFALLPEKSNIRIVLKRLRIKKKYVRSASGKEIMAECMKGGNRKPAGTIIYGWQFKECPFFKHYQNYVDEFAVKSFNG